jgi:hypothetical protein
MNNFYTPLHCLYSLPGTLLKGLLTFNTCPVPCCPSCLLSCLSQLIYSAKELYPNTQFNIIVLVFIFEFCKLIITYVIDCPRGSVLSILFILSGCPVLGILCYTCALLLSFLSWFAMTSHNTCLSHLLQEKERSSFCPITAVLMAVLSFVLDILDVLDVLLCLLYHICPALPVLACFLFLQMLSTLSFRV